MNNRLSVQWDAFADAVTATIPLFVAIAALSGIVTMAVTLAGDKKGRTFFITLGHTFLFASLGAYVGYGTGASREPIVGAIIPALLTLLAAALGYLFNRQQVASSVWKLLSVPSLTSFLLGCILATVIGGQARLEVEAYQNQQALCETHYTTFVAPICVEGLKVMATDKPLQQSDSRHLISLCADVFAGGHPCSYQAEPASAKTAPETP
jgi:hypothetical protein